MSLVNYLLEQTAVYSLWQSPFAEAKLAPMLANNDIGSAQRVLDVGCGPAINTHLFAHADYLGIDVNPAYIRHARSKYNRRFVAADATTYSDAAEAGFDFILVNSFLHHLDTRSTNRVLERLGSWLSPGGHIHLLEPVLPAKQSIARQLAKWDRGKHWRSLEEWRALFDQHAEIIVFETYPLRKLGLTLWNMVYCKGRAKR
jgi:SAM-dependent methyltransferase